MKQLVLLGGGHAHVRVLADLVKRPLPGWHAVLISPYRRQIYSGMLPGWIGGHYGIDECAIPLDVLSDRAGVQQRLTAATSLDLDRHLVRCEDGTDVRFDALSIDTGPVTGLATLPGAQSHATCIRPIEGFVAAWPRLVDSIRATCRRFDILVVGAGAAGVELAFAIKYRATLEGWSHVYVGLLGASALPLDGLPQTVALMAQRLLARKGVQWHPEARVSEVREKAVTLEDGSTKHLDACLVVTGAAAPSWPRQSGLATDASGFICVGSTLQSTSHPMVFAAGDIASYHTRRPKSGVFAVRAGPILAENLRAHALGRRLRSWTPQARALYLIGTGGRHAMASWGDASLGGKWVWHWKDWIDRRFVRRASTVDG